MSIMVRPISTEQHLSYIGLKDSVSFLQTPAWAKVKSGWQGESLGWFDGDELIGVGLVLYRKLPILNRYLAYLPEGPLLDWERTDLAAQLKALIKYSRANKAFAVRIGPQLVHRRWNAETIKAAIADETISLLTQVPPDQIAPRASAALALLGQQRWESSAEDETGFPLGQPKTKLQLPLRQADGTPKTEAELLAGMNQQWRRNIKKAEKSGVTVRLGEREDLSEFYRVYLETAERDKFLPRAFGYLETLWDCLIAEDPDRIRLYLAEHDGVVIAATMLVRVGDHAWYGYGGSTTSRREVKGSNAIQWRMIRDSLAAGCSVYDLRGIAAGVSSDDPEVGLTQFKVGTGGQAVATLGEWSYPINPLLYFGFKQYLKHHLLS